MQGIDVSSHDNFNGSVFKANTEMCYGQSDFVIVKATQGTGYVYKGCDSVYQRCKRDGKLRGFYHYAGGNDPVAEADYFVKNTSGYFGDGIPVIDWESYQNKSWGNTSWVRRFVDRVYALTKVWCMIYVQASAISQVANCANNCALWVAGYPDYRNNWNIPKFTYRISPWSAYTLWQYSSSNEQTDRNVANITADGWNAIARGDRSAAPTPAPEPVKPPLPDALKSYTDLDSEAWYIKPLETAVTKGYIHGYSDTQMGPNDALTRGQAVCLVANIAGFKAEYPFSDVKADPYYYAAVEWAKEQGIVSGYDGSFYPDNACARQDFAVMLWNYKGKPEPVGRPTGFNDWESVADWAKSAVAWCVENAVINGNAGNIRPADPCTRAEAAAMIVNFTK